MGRKANTPERVLERLKELHPEGWESILPDSLIYTSAHEPLSLACALHGQFSMRLAWGGDSKRRPHICPTCYEETLSKQLKLEGRPAQLSGHHRGKRKTDEEWVARFREAHGDCYEYPMPFEYKLEEQNRQKQVKMICPAHGVFYQRAFAHAAGSVCPRCRSQGYKF